MKNDKEIVGVLLGFDDYVSILLSVMQRNTCYGMKIRSVVID